MAIYFTRHAHKKSIKRLRVHYHELIGQNKEYEGKYLIRYGYMLDNVLEEIKEIIGIERLNDAKILIHTDDKLQDDIILNNVVILMICLIKDDGKFYP